MKISCSHQYYSQVSIRCGEVYSIIYRNPPVHMGEPISVGEVVLNSYSWGYMGYYYLIIDIDVVSISDDSILDKGIDFVGVADGKLYIDVVGEV